MKITKIILIVSVVICTSFAKTEIYAQGKSNLNLEISKPLLEYSLFDRYIFDAGIGYNAKINRLSVGASLNVTYSKLKGEYNTQTYLIKPRINLTYTINMSARFNFEPKIGLGYSVICINNKKYEFSDLQQGINAILELKFNYITNTSFDYYFMINYDYTYLNKDKDFTQLDYYRNIHLVSFGIGAKLKFYEKDEK